MPLAKVTNIGKNSTWLLWHITEDTETLRSQSFLTSNELSELEKVSHATKIKELLAGKLATKYLVDLMGEKYQGIYKDEYGKPHLEQINWGLSISHSYPYAAVIIDRLGPTGIDIEKPQAKLRNISKKFLNEKELVACGNNLEALCIYWSAKEVLYKHHGRKSLKFKENLNIIERGHSQPLNGEIILPEGKTSLDLAIERVNGYIICYTCFM